MWRVYYVLASLNGMYLKLKDGIRLKTKITDVYSMEGKHQKK